MDTTWLRDVGATEHTPALSGRDGCSTRPATDAKVSYCLFGSGWALGSGGDLGRGLQRCPLSAVQQTKAPANGRFPRRARALRTHHQRDQAADLTQDCGRLLAPRDQRTTSWQSRMDAASPSGRVLTNTESKGCWDRDGERMRQRGAVYHFACRAFFMFQRIPRDRVFERRAALYNRPKLRRLATPCFPTIRESCSAIFMMLSARSTCWLKLTSASDGVGSPEGWL